MEINAVSNADNSMQEKETVKPPSRLTVFLYAFAAATFFGSINAFEIISTDNGQHSWGEAFAHALLLWYLFLPIVPLAIVLAKKLPAARAHRLRDLFIHSLVALAVGAIHPFAYILIYSLAIQPRWVIVVAKSQLPYLHFWYMRDLLIAVLAYAVTVTATQAFIYYRSFQRGQMKASHQKARPDVSEEIPQVLNEPSARPQPMKRILVKAGDKALFVRPAEIAWIEAQGNYVALHVGAQSYLLRQTITALEASLDPAKFQRIERSRIVNLDAIREMLPAGRGEYEIVLKDGVTLKLSHTYRDSFLRFATGAL
ncbi:MAG: LytTR family DNA-binding domain-containing protein [Terracidiphilus sp.]